MVIFLMMAAGVLTALATCRWLWREAPRTGDAAIGIAGGIIGAATAEMLAGSALGVALPLLLTCAATLALEGLRQAPGASDEGGEVYDSTTSRLG